MLLQKIQQDGVSLRALHKVLVVTALMVSAILLISTYRSSDEYGDLAGIADEYITMQKSAVELMDASDYLTEMVQRYTLAGEREYLDNYFEEAQVTKRREEAIETMATGANEQKALAELQQAMSESVALMDREYYAMRLVIEATDLDSYPSILDDVSLTDEDAALSNDEKMDRAREMVLGREYYEEKDLIREDMHDSLAELEAVTQQTQDEAITDLGASMRMARIVIIFQTILVVVMIYLTSRLGINPVLQAVHHINDDHPIPEIGANEFRYLARTYNKMYQVYKRSLDRLNFKASHDELTQVYNRAGYDLILSALDMKSTFMIMFDLDNFKSINDTFGHEAGDLVLQKVARVVSNNFRSDDYVCRIGGDEFVVFMVHSSKQQRSLLQSKIENINEQLGNTDDGLPPTSISAGIAHGEQAGDAAEWMRVTDAALYETKHAGKSGATFYEG